MTASFGPVVRLLEVDPDLGECLSPEAREAATALVRARVGRIPAGSWRPPPIPPSSTGFLVLDGLLVRRLRLGSSSSTELIGPTDLVRPGEDDSLPSLLPTAAEWKVLQEARVAILDSHLTAMLGRWPELAAAISARFLRRARSLAVLMAAQHFTRVTDRLLTSLWYMAGMWGRVTREGTVLPFRLTHEMLGEIIGARRPTTTQAILALEDRGQLRRDERRRLVLLGEPPDWETAAQPLARVEV